MKFTTTNSTLFTNNNSNQIPEWISGLNVEVKERESYDLNFEKKGSFADSVSIYRESLNATPRNMINNINTTTLVTDSKIQLAKFLVGKYYKVETKVSNNIAVLNVNIQNTPAIFKFAFFASDGKVEAPKTFFASYNDEEIEYPYSFAGLEECLEDIKSNKSRPIKVDGIGQVYMINREEIIRRYNGKLREATDKINELLSSGDIIGVGSNTYGSVYDVDYLFPQMEKEASAPKVGSFEFAPNKEHVAAKPIASIKELQLNVNKTLSKLFNDFKVNKCIRDNNELLVNADVLNNFGVRNVCHFCFGIENEKLASLKYLEMNEERMTIDQLFNKMKFNTNLLESYVSEASEFTKKIYRGSVLTKKDIQSKLNKLVSSDNVDNIINNWHSNKLLTAINSTTFVTEKTFEELLSSINATLLSDEEKEIIKHYSKKFGEGLDVNRNDVEDTGFRNDKELIASNEIRLFNLNSYLSKHFKDFTVNNLNGNMADLCFLDRNAGINNKIKLKCTFENNNIDDVLAIINNKHVGLNSVSSAFNKSEILSRYIENKNNLISHPIIITKAKLKRQLSTIAKSEDIDEILKLWYLNSNIVDLDAQTVASKVSLETLLNNVNIKPLSDKDVREIQLAKQYFGEKQKFARESIKDTGVREADEYVSDETLLVKANELLSKYFKSFKTIDFKLNNENLNYLVEVFDEETGLTMNMNLYFKNEKNKILDAYAIVNDEKIKLKNIKAAFGTNKVLSKFLQMNPNKKTKSPMVITINQLKNKLSDIAKIDCGEIDFVINSWINTGKVDKIAQNVLASKYNLEQLISLSNLKALSDEEIKERINKAQRNKLSKISECYINDNDTRQVAESWSPEKILNHIKNEISKTFNDFEILNADINDDKYKIVARVVNPSIGVREQIEFDFNIDNGKPSSIFKILNQNKSLDNEALNRYIAYNGSVNKINKSIISKNLLSKKLSSIIDQSEIDKIINKLMDENIINAIGNNSFVTSYSMNEIVNTLSNLNALDLNAGDNNLINSIRDEKIINTKEKLVMDNNSRLIESPEKELSPKMKNLRDKIYNIATNSLKNKLITNKKLESIKISLNNSKCENDLESIWKDLKRYL